VKFRISRDDLADAVSWAARALPARPTIPVLSGVVLEAGDDGLRLSSFDHEVAARCQIGADVSEPGRVLVPGRLLADIARTLPNQDVLISSQNEPRVELECGRSRFTLPTLGLDEYPTLPSMPDVVGSLSRAEFARVVAQVAIAAGRDDTLPVLTGIRVELTDRGLTWAATDRYRLAMREVAWTPNTTGIDLAALVPARTLADAAKAFTGETVEIALSDGGDGAGLLGLSADSHRTTMRLLSGEFPKYRSLLPSDTAAVATASTETLMDALRRVALVVERATPVRLTFNDGTIVLEAGSGEGAMAREEVEGSLSGDEITIAFNPGYLLDGLTAMNSPQVQFSFTTATKPAVLQPLTGDSDTPDGEYRYLLMPVRLAG
jgi:DNA polymerase-3 subunit beta